MPLIWWGSLTDAFMQSAAAVLFKASKSIAKAKFKHADADIDLRVM
jgi:hypothetical protein